MQPTGETSAARPTPGPVEQLVRFDGSAEQFLHKLLDVQCHAAGATRGVMLRQGQNGAEVLALHPAGDQSTLQQVWVAQACELAGQVTAGGQATIAAIQPGGTFYGVKPEQHLLMLPLVGGSGVRGATALVIDSGEREQVEQAARRVEPTAGFLALYEMRTTLRQRTDNMQRLRQACEMLGSVNAHARYRAAAMALCDQLADAHDAERVSLGWVKGRYVKVGALSHTEKFTRKMELVAAIESAMEECADQDAEVVYPVAEESTVVNRAAGELSARERQAAVLSLPLRHGDNVVGVVTIERPADRPFEPEQIEALRLTCDLCTARLADLERRDRWIGARLATSVREAGSWIVGPTHTWAKLAAVVVAGVLLFAVLGRGTYRVEAPMVIEAVQRQAITAPLDGYLLRAPGRIGDEVTADQTVLAELDTAQLKLQRAEAQAEHRRHMKQAQVARRESKISEEQIALAEAERLAAQTDLLDWKIERATIRSPIDGVIVQGDLSKQIGGPVETGQQLFEVAPLDRLRVKLAVAEDRVVDLAPGQSGRLAAASHPGRRLAFEIERIDPMAQVVDQRNVFEVQGRLSETQPWLRPGMEGLAKVDVGEASYAWLWTRDLLNWIRMKLWL